MSWIIIGIIAFLLFIIYDVNSLRWQNAFLHKFFAAGFALLAFSTIGIFAYHQRIRENWHMWKIIAVLLAVFFIAALLYTLFFALPFEDTYCTNESASANEPNRRSAYTGGVYALCRHPGVLWFAGFYACLSILAWNNAITGYSCVVTGCNILYILFQDKITFPQTFDNYGDYQKSTPFLIPNRKSIKECINYFAKRGEKK